MMIQIPKDSPPGMNSPLTFNLSYSLGRRNFVFITVSVAASRSRRPSPLELQRRSLLPKLEPLLLAQELRRFRLVLVLASSVSMRLSPGRLAKGGL